MNAFKTCERAEKNHSEDGADTLFTKEEEKRIAPHHERESDDGLIAVFKLLFHLLFKKIK